jgi:hypothetical protein
MPQYDDVPDDDQLSSSRRRTVAAVPPPPRPADPWVAITTTVPSSVRDDVKVACAIHGVKLKDAVTDALRTWLADHPARTN